MLGEGFAPPKAQGQHVYSVPGLSTSVPQRKIEEIAFRVSDSRSRFPRSILTGLLALLSIGQIPIFELSLKYGTKQIFRIAEADFAC